MNVKKYETLLCGQNKNTKTVCLTFNFRVKTQIHNFLLMLVWGGYSFRWALLDDIEHILCVLHDPRLHFKLYCANRVLGIFLNCSYTFHRSEVGPKHLHFQQAPTWCQCCWSVDRISRSKNPHQLSFHFQLLNLNLFPLEAAYPLPKPCPLQQRSGQTWFHNGRPEWTTDLGSWFPAEATQNRDILNKGVRLSDEMGEFGYSAANVAIHM